MTTIKQTLLEFSDFLEENEKELTKAEYGPCIEDIYGQLTDIIDHQVEEPYNIVFDDGFIDNEDD